MRYPKKLIDIIPEKYKYVVDLYLKHSNDVYKLLQGYQEYISSQYISGVPDISEWLKT